MKVYISALVSPPKLFIVARGLLALRFKLDYRFAREKAGQAPYFDGRIRFHFTLILQQYIDHAFCWTFQLAAAPH